MSTAERSVPVEMIDGLESCIQGSWLARQYKKSQAKYCLQVLQEDAFVMGSQSSGSCIVPLHLSP